MWKILGIVSLSTMFGMAYLGAVLAVVFLLADLPVVALNILIIPVCCVPALAYLLWIAKERRSPMVKAQNIVAGIWIIALSTALAHAVTRIP